MYPFSILNNVVFLDIETTGLNPLEDRIIEIGAVKIKDNIVTKFSSLVDPKMEVPLNILDLCTGINQEALESAPELDEVMNNLVDFIEEFPIICHNAAFEKSFLKVENKFLDSLELIAILFPEFHEFNLQYLMKKLLPKNRIEIHRGLSDSEDTIEVVNYAISMFYFDNGFTIPMSITELEAWDWYRFITNINMDDVKNFISNIPQKTKVENQKKYTVFALKDYEKLFENEDIWKRNRSGYKLRPQQRDASRFIKEGLEGNKFTIMEAPTGLGKSMAYLLPASIYTHLEEEKVIVSTNTKGLQNQLVDKDIPNLLEALNLKNDISYTLIKGKSNYLCYYRFEDIEYPKDMKNLIGYIYLKRLITEKSFGDIEEINYLIKEKFNLSGLLEQCFCDSELCDVDSCKYRDMCYYASKVEALKEAQLIVVNHSLLVKWPYQSVAPLENIVIDEAHNLVQEAYEAFEETLVSYEFYKFLTEIYDEEGKNGFLYYLSLRAKNNNLPLKNIQIGINHCLEQIENVGLAFDSYINSNLINRDYNIKEHLNKNNPNMTGIIKCLQYLKEDIADLNLNIDKAVNVLKEITALEKDKRLKIMIEKVEVISGYIKLIENVIEQSKNDHCFYFEVEKNLKWWKISSIPLDVSSDFYEKVLKGTKSCLFISATLSTDNGYNNLKNNLGISIAKSQHKEIIEVPPIEPVFDYKGRSAIYSFDSMDPNDIGAFSEEMKSFVLELLNNIEGNIIILFTSKKRLQAFKSAAALELKNLDVRIVEGKKDIEKLKSREKRFILLGSKGFFEGIDIPGDTMTNVILDKVPNINSKEPLYKSLVEKGLERGKDYWQSYANVNFPIVSIDLKQIYGRIIRTEYDYGALFIMSKFDRNNSTIRKLEKQLHGVPIVRKEQEEIFKDLKLRTLRWKQMNLYKIMKEVKNTLFEELKRKKQENNSSSIKDVESYVNNFMLEEYEKRNLKYDVHIYFTEQLMIYINGIKINLGNNKKAITQYFEDILCF
ncbi:exonuclease domain-containing protein [Clostridium fungisolvens]|uniref:DNA 5'-3' helicase n=1 Tax=Clostridium fungisolvens TaxID=1604897 RepID=A0A6V8SKU9_9CLOT|nr:helicase C-terminal domain-containing protein [Clostridium fungisolvens]GFP75788.1 3'-5' exonuclease DinG [Clostridium fungisolvens]